jgi:hypothetical protein
MRRACMGYVFFACLLVSGSSGCSGCGSAGQPHTGSSSSQAGGDDVIKWKGLDTGYEAQGGRK